jgi:hypothetical protein
MNHYNSLKALAGTIVSSASTTLAWVSLNDAKVFATIGASFMAIVSGGFAARYYWYAAKEKKQNLK